MHIAEHIAEHIAKHTAEHEAQYTAKHMAESHPSTTQLFGLKLRLKPDSPHMEQKGSPRASNSGDPFSTGKPTHGAKGDPATDRSEQLRRPIFKREARTWSKREAKG